MQSKSVGAEASNQEPSLLSRTLTVLERIASGESATAVFAETGIVAAVREAVAEEERPSFVLIQEGGSSSELYLHAHPSLEEAEEDRKSCARDGAYRTSPIVEVPGAVARHGEQFYEAVEAVLRSLGELECVPTPDEDDEQLSILVRYAVLQLVEGHAFESWTPMNDPERDWEDFSLQIGDDGDAFISLDQVKEGLETLGLVRWLHFYQHNINGPWKAVIQLPKRDEAREIARSHGIDVMPPLEEVKKAALAVAEAN